jgi:cytoskeletal protein CcmA (bactofilin family)
MATKLMDVPPPKPRNGGKSSMPSIVSEGLHISGNLFSDGDVQIDGRIEGDIQGRNVTVGASGAVIGKLSADEANVSGSVTGEIQARMVTLARSAKVQCDITQETLVIEAGAMFEGNCRRSGSTTAKGANGAMAKSSELLLSAPAETVSARAHD